MKLLPSLVIVALGLGGAGALAQASAEREVTAALERLRASFGPGATLTIASREVDPLGGRLRLSGVSLEDGTRRLRVDSATLLGVTEARLGRLELRGLAMTDQGDTRITAQRLTLAGLTLPAPGESFTFGTLRLVQGEVERFALEAPGGLGMTAQSASVEGLVPGRVRNLRVDGLRADRAGDRPVTVALGRIALAGFSFPDPSDQPAPTAFTLEAATLEALALATPSDGLSITLERMGLRDAVPGRLAEIGLDHLAVAAPMAALGRGAYRLARLEMAGLDWVGVIAALARQGSAPEPQPDIVQRFLAEGLSLTLEGRDLATIGRIASSGLTDSTGLSTGSLTVEDLRLALPEGAAPPLAAMGYGKIRGEADSEGLVQGDSAFLSMAIRLPEAASLAVATHAVGLPDPSQLRGTSDESLAALLQARLAAFSLTLTDQGLIDRAATWMGDQRGQTAARVREDWAQMAQTLSLPGVPLPPRGAAAAQDPFAPMRDAITAFLRGGGTLDVAMRPADPIPLAELGIMAAMPPATLVARTGLTVMRR
jgi:hypothetical protein